MWYKKIGKFFCEKNVKIEKWEHTFKGFASFLNVEILNSLNTKLQLKDTESAVTFSDDKTKYNTFY